MKKFYLLIGATVGIAIATLPTLSRSSTLPTNLLAQTTQSPWQVFTSNLGRFTVEFPKPPKITSYTQELEGEFSTQHLFVTEKESDQRFIVAYLDLPSALLQGQSQEILDRVVAQTLNNQQMRILKDNQRSITLGEYPGKEFRLEQNGKMVVMRLYLVKNRLYLLSTQSLENTEIEQFLNSFQLL